jgi:O-antigen/teichoic acid export membrane protein
MKFFINIFKSTLFKSTIVYGFSSALNAAIPLLILPILTRYLNPDDYGMLTVFMTLIAVCNVLIGLNTNGAIFNKYFFSKTIASTNFTRYLNTTLSILTINTALFLTLAFVFKNYLLEATLIPFHWLLLAILSSLFQYIILINLSLKQAENKASHYAGLLLLQTILNIGISLSLVIFYQLNWIGRAWGILLALFITSLICLYIQNKKFKLSVEFNLEDAKSILNFGLPLVPHALGAVFISLADRFLLSSLVGNTELGLYQAGVQVGMIMLLFTDAFNKAFAPWLYNALEKNSADLKIKIVRSTYLYFVLILVAALIVSLIPKSLILAILGEKYSNSDQYIFWAALAFAFNGMYLMVCNYIFYSNQTKYLSYITLPIGIFNLGLSYYFINKFGAVGACMSMAISYLIMFLLTWYRSAKLVKMPWIEGLQIKR